MTAHAKYALGGSRISKVLNLALAIPATKAGCAECLVTRQDRQVLNLVATGTAAIGAVVADEGAIAEK